MIVIPIVMLGELLFVETGVLATFWPSIIPSNANNADTARIEPIELVYPLQASHGSERSRTIPRTTPVKPAKKPNSFPVSKFPLFERSDARNEPVRLGIAEARNHWK